MNDIGFSIFARAPVAGRTKTRLIPALGAEGAKRLYERMLDHTVHMVSATRMGAVELWCTPCTDHPVFAKYRDELGVVLHTQVGAGLGERMHHAVQIGLKNYSAVIVLGSDCVAMNEGYLRAAVSSLSVTEVVLGPADDGGYVLLGLRQNHPVLFSGIPWGSARVLDSTLRRLRQGEVTYTLLDVLPDIDRPADLKRLPSQWLRGRARSPLDVLTNW